MWQQFGIAIALLLVIEGIIPFLSPTGWRKTLQVISEMPDEKVRLIGFVSMISGVILLYLIH
ncbi:putative transmembrane protein [Thioploca ingrica]|uniref:Putative transmembrane protein n=1 Tax=Thioploca ingrica TaxID=40754 RepID=A0A090BVE0_9GAMM|nr:putative transmembrane protein [Thioploca ingrica]